jgi:thiol-disulfide isomerase/thioredoxin
MKETAVAALRIIGFAAALLLVAVLVGGEAHPLEAGSAAPPIVGTTLDGATVKARATGPRPFVVNVWATWCPPCLAELPAFAAAARTYEGKVDFVGLAAESKAADVVALRDRFGVGYPLFLIDAVTQRMWNATALPSTYIVAADGRVLWSIRGAIDAHLLDDKIHDLLGL